jgi:YbgC/YbaW family acyl-CoA thioester hydrolase
MPHFTHRARVAFVDTDASGRIHFTAMLRYYETAEQEFLRSLGLGHHLLPPDVGFPRVRVECEYRSAVIFDDELDISVSVKRVGTTSYTLEFIARKGDTIAANGGFVVVCVSRARGHAQALPDVFREALSKSAAIAR